MPETDTLIAGIAISPVSLMFAVKYRGADDSAPGTPRKDEAL